MCCAVCTSTATACTQQPHNTAQHYHNALEWFVQVVHGCAQHVHEGCGVNQQPHTMVLYQLIKLALLVCEVSGEGGGSRWEGQTESISACSCGCFSCAQS